MSKDIILFVNAIRPATFAALDAYEKETGRTFTPIVLVDSKINASISECNLQDDLPVHVTKIVADFDSPKSMRLALMPYMDRLFAVTTQYENSILELKKLIPYVPHLPTPIEQSLDWATEKTLMRELLEVHNPQIIPSYLEVSNHREATIREIERTMSYPLIVKPSGLEGSLLVTRVENRAQLRRTLKHTFHEIQKAYDKWIKRQEPTVLVEEFMEGDMYSVDTYVSPEGVCRHTPPVKVLTGRNVGFDDFFGYMRLAPAGLTSDDITNAYDVAEQACAALNLRAVTAHVELMKTPKGWKIIELGPRIGGGSRHEIYSESFGINHIVNDIRNRAGEEPVIPMQPKKSMAVFWIYAREEGVLASVKGIREVKQLSSFVSIGQDIKVGDPVQFAKNNGDPVLVLTLSHVDEAQLAADIEQMEAVLQLTTRPIMGLPDSYLEIVDNVLQLDYIRNGSLQNSLMQHRQV